MSALKRGKPYWDWVVSGDAELIEANPDSVESLSPDERRVVITEVLTKLVNYQAAQIFTVNEHLVFKRLLGGIAQVKIAKELNVTPSRCSKLMKQVGAKIKKLYDKELENY